MKAILGTKVGMTQLWDDKGRLIGVTVIKAEPNFTYKQNGTTTLITEAKQKINKAQQKIAGRFGFKGGIWQKTIKNFETDDEKLTVSQFTAGEYVAVSGVTKGKGFAGVVKRHGFAGWPSSHGHSHQRRPGSIGAQQPQRVLKGKKMAGHMGARNLTVRGNKIIAVNEQENLIIISGAIPGANRSKVMVKTLDKAKK